MPVVYEWSYKSATTSRAWSQPLPEAFLKPPALLVIADSVYTMRLEANLLSARKSVGTPVAKSPFAIPNVRLFIAFRVFFNARFYYPVFTILFLDFGLTLDQFALLNAAWAASIVMLEVPSGALADTIGRRNLLIVTGILMVIEILLLCFVPLGNAGLLFAVFLVNRVLSGAAEAAASVVI